jgi:DNA-binding beta-propeller fold protein YncE
MRRLIPFALSCVLLSGCFGPSDGVAVPVDSIYFPVGLALDKDSTHLFVVSSDFDLQYNAGAIQSYEVDGRDGLVELMPKACGEPGGLCAREGTSQLCKAGERSASERLLYPGRCLPVTPTVKDSVKIGAFATDAVLRQDPEGERTRLFVPVRGDSTLHWLDVDQGFMECGQSANDGACDDEHRAGDKPSDNTRGIKLNSEPFGIDASEHAESILVTNQTTGTVSLFVNEWPAAPRLEFALSSPDRIPRRPVGIAALPSPAAAGAEAQGDTYLLAFRDSPQVRLVRYEGDQGSAGSRPFLVDGGGAPITANSVGSDSRGIAVDKSARDAAEARCGGDQACLEQAALVPLDVYVANRAPSSLLIGRTRPPEQYPYFYDSLPLTAGPSRVVVGTVNTPNGKEQRVFVACFDSRRIFVYDPLRGRMETEILTGRGPHAMAVDTDRSLLFVAHFTDSYVGVYSLNLAFPESYGSMLATLGSPQPPRSSK